MKVIQNTNGVYVVRQPQPVEQQLIEDIGSIRFYAELDESERAHSIEKEAWRRVLQAIAEGHANPQELARDALKTLNIDFHRWFS